MAFDSDKTKTTPISRVCFYLETIILPIIPPRLPPALRSKLLPPPPKLLFGLSSWGLAHWQWLARPSNSLHWTFPMAAVASSSVVISTKSESFWSASQSYPRLMCWDHRTAWAKASFKLPQWLNKTNHLRIIFVHNFPYAFKGSKPFW